MVPSLGGLAKNEQNGFQELGLPDRFDEIRRDAKLTAAGGVTAQSGRGQHHDRASDKGWIFLELVHDYEAVHARHLGIQQNQRKSFAHVPRAPHGDQTLLAPPHQGGLHRPAFEHGLQNTPVGNVIVNDEHRSTLQVDLCQGSGLWLRPFHKAKLRREMEPASFVLFALHPNSAFHQVYQSGRDSQAQTGPTILSCG